MAKSGPGSPVERAARVAGLRSFRTPTLEAVEQRRLQLWVLTVLLFVTLAVALVVFAFRPDLRAPEWLTPRAAEAGFLTLVGLFCAYAIEKEIQLRRLTGLLVDERVLTAALTGRVRELSALLEAGRALNLDLDLGEVLERILRCAMDLLGGRDASLMLVHGEDELSTVFAVGRSGARGARVRLGQGIAGRVAESRDPLLIDGLLDHGEDYVAQPETDPPPESAMSAPLIHRGALLGVLNLNARSGRRYTEHDLRALALFAEQAATAVANAQLYEAQRLIASQSSYQALHDPLTRLPNRARFLDRLRHALETPRPGDRRVALLFVDLDDFKRINDSLGHLVGDEVLVSFAERIKGVVRSGDAVARFGGDEFALLVDGVRSQEEAAMVAEGVLAVLDEPFPAAGRQVRLTASIGISLAESASTAESLLRSADIALHAAKERGKSGLAVFAEAMHADILRRLDLEGELRRAVERDELEVHYQPIFALASRRPVAVEALLRWHHPDRGMLPAASFVSFAEQVGVLRELDLWALREACVLGCELSGYGGRRSPLGINVNLLPTRLHDPEIVDRVAGVLRDTGLPPERLVLEITERAVVADADGSAGRLAALKDLGVRLALDDFGTGYSSLSYLRRFPVHTIKVDRAFTDGLGQDPSQITLVRAIVKFGQSLGLRVIAEGVEREDQVQSLISLGCSLGQGYHLCEPLSPTDLERFLGSQARPS